MCRTLFLVVSLSLPAGVHAQPKDTDVQKRASELIELKIRAILTAKNPTDGRGLGAADIYAELFKSIGKDGIRKLKSHANDGVAVQAAWEETSSGSRERKWFVGF